MRILGIDYGTKRLGLALSDENGILASPLPSYLRRGHPQDLTFLVQLIARKEAKRIVIGLPKNMNGSLGTMAKEVLSFATALRERTSVPVVPFDERLTTFEADRLLVQANVSRTRRKGLRDRLAAVLILQGYLESLRNHPAGGDLSSK